MRKYLLALAVAVCASPALNARLVNPSTMHSSLQSPTQKMLDKAGLTSFTTKRVLASKSRDARFLRTAQIGAPTVPSTKGAVRATRADNEYEVTVKLAVDYVKWIPQAVAFYAPGYEKWFESDDENPTSVDEDIPAGTYQALGYFIELNEEGFETGSAIVVAEDVVVEKDMTITLDPETATNVISSKAYNPAGEAYQIQQVAFKDNGTEDPDVVVVREGNVGQAMTVRNTLLHKDIGEIFWTQVGVGAEIVNSEDFPDIADTPFEEMCVMRVNPLSDRFISAVSVTALPDDKANYVQMSKTGTATGELTNAGAPFSTVSIPMANTELGPESPFPKSETPLRLDMSYYFGGKLFSGLDFGEMKAENNSITYCAAPAPGLEKEFVDAAEASLEDYVSSYSCDTTYDGDWMWVTEEKTFTSNISPKVLLSTPNYVMNYTYDPFYEYPHADLTPEQMVAPAVRHTVEELLQPMGCSPVYSNVVPYSEVDAEDGEAEIVPFAALTYGYAGEMDGFYSNEAKPAIVYNGNPVDYDEEYYSDFWSGGFFGWCYDWNDTDPAPGTYDFTFTAPMKIDGLEGESRIHYAFDQRQEDNVPPALQYLQFCDASNNVTCRFGESSEGVMRIVAGDFVYKKRDCYDEDCVNEYLGYVGECEPEVAYAPFGTQEWNKLELRKTADALLPFAATYEADLSQVTGKAPLGWFSLQIYMRDASGNVNEQLIAPAFCISSLSGVSEVRGGAFDVRYSDGVVSVAGGQADMRVYSADGSMVYHGNGAALDMSRFGKGLYVVAVSDGRESKALKVVVR